MNKKRSKKKEITNHKKTSVDPRDVETGMVQKKKKHNQKARAF